MLCKAQAGRPHAGEEFWKTDGGCLAPSVFPVLLSIQAQPSPKIVTIKSKQHIPSGAEV